MPKNKIVIFLNEGLFSGASIDGNPEDYELHVVHQKNPLDG